MSKDITENGTDGLQSSLTPEHDTYATTDKQQRLKQVCAKIEKTQYKQAHHYNAR